MNIKKTVFIILASCVTLLWAQAQKTEQLHETLAWKVVTNGTGPLQQSWFIFDKAIIKNVASKLPVYKYIVHPQVPSKIKAEVTNAVTADVLPHELACLNNPEIPAALTPEVIYYTENKKPAARIELVPLVKDAATGTIKKVISFTLNITYTPDLGATLQASYTWAENSMLASGKWIKVSIGTTGVYKLDVNYLTGAGLAANDADISSIRLYGLGGGTMPQLSAAPKNDDLVENAIAVQDINGDGKFNGGDYLLFYGEGAHVWEFDPTKKKYAHRHNPYANENYYFVTIGQPGGKRIATQQSEPGAANYITSAFDELYYYEKDLANLLKSGREWFGEEYDRVLTYNYPPIEIPDLVTSENVKIQSQAVARSPVLSYFTATCNGTPVLTQAINSVSIEGETDFIAPPDIKEASFPVSGNVISISYTYNKTSPSAKGWLNYYEIIARRNLRKQGQQLIFRDSRSVDSANLTRFEVDDNGQNITIWDITNRLAPKIQQTSKSGSQHSFTLSTPSLREFVAFTDNDVHTPSGYAAVSNQNLHGLRNIDFVIITHPDFMKEAERLADFHKTHDGMNVAVVTPQQVYNEFSSGRQDVTAIRNFMKMLYDRPANTGDEIKYLLMFGDASYDYKNRGKNGIVTIPNTNFVPTYQSRNSAHMTFSYCSDDYYGQLDDNEGEWSEDINFETLDIGIGRIPVQTPEQARQMVDKIISYTNKAAFGEWRNNICFIADDEDFNDHIDDGENLSATAESNDKTYNIDKIYLDAYKQKSVGSGNRYPDVNDLINRKVAKGALIINYNGHGGEQGLAHEQIVDVPMINAWKNKNNLPLFITATCEFSRFDDPARTSAGELVLLNPTGGGIGLLTTVRLVYSAPNYDLNDALYRNNVFATTNGEFPRIGDVFRKTKNGAIYLNSRNFTLLGDPALMLAYPKQNVVTTEINGQNAQGAADTAGALSKITIKGEIQDAAGARLTGFNGTLYTTVFDKKTQINTLVNDPASLPLTFSMYKNIIYKGKASVKNGEFEFSFIVPQDISYIQGNGKISYYAYNDVTDANGYYDNIVISGADVSAPADVTGPSVRLFMNDTNFRMGGITDENPTLLALVSDLHGINTTGNGIGRDITAILDGDRSHQIVLNDYYQAKLDSYQDGEVRYPFFNLAEGHHNIKIKVWDVYNNSAEGYTEFVVAKSSKLAISHLMNYPNPFSERTKIYFEHNRQGQELFIEVDIYNTSGQRLETLTAHVAEGESNFDGLEWVPLSNGLSNVSQGIYFFRVKVRSGSETVEETEKMVFIK